MCILQLNSPEYWNWGICCLTRIGLHCSVCIMQYENNRKQQDKSGFKGHHLEKDLILVEMQIAERIFKQASCATLVMQCFCMHYPTLLKYPSSQHFKVTCWVWWRNMVHHYFKERHSCQMSYKEQIPQQTLHRLFSLQQAVSLERMTHRLEPFTLYLCSILKEHCSTILCTVDVSYGKLYLLITTDFQTHTVQRNIHLT